MTEHAPALEPLLRERLAQDGFLRVEGIATAAERQILSGIYDRCFASDAPEGLRLKALGGLLGGRQLMPQVFTPSRFFPEIDGLAYVRRADELARELLGPEATLRGEHMILKPAGFGAVTPWHQDQAYHDPGFDYRNLNFWLPLDGADEDSGCMHFVPGSHLGPILPHRRAGGEADASAAEALAQDYWSANGVALPCQPGDATIHASYCLHYAGPNRSQRPRRAYIRVYGIPPTPRARPWRLPWLDDLMR